MSSQEVIDFIQSKISQRDENGELRLLSSIVEEVSPRVEESECLVCTAYIFCKTRAWEYHSLMTDAKP